MQKLTRYFPVLLGFGLLGCPATAPSSFEQAAGEVDDTLVALSEGDPDATFGAADEIEVDDADDAVADDGPDGGVDDDAAGEQASDHSHRGRRGERPRGRGHGVGLLVWYADLDALKVCRDLRATCPTSADPSACAEQVKACVLPVLEQAFKTICDEQIATCDASGQSEKPCEHIRDACSSDAGHRSEDRSVSGEDHDESAEAEHEGGDVGGTDDGAEHDAEEASASEASDTEKGGEPAADGSSDTPSGV